MSDIKYVRIIRDWCGGVALFGWTTAWVRLSYCLFGGWKARLALAHAYFGDSKGQEYVDIFGPYKW